MPPAVTDLGNLIKLRYVNKLSYDQIGELVGITGPAVYGRLEHCRALMEGADTEGAFQAQESAILAGIRLKLLAHGAKDEIIEKMSGYQSFGSYGLLFDKQRILDGKSTANIAVLSKLIDNGQEIGDNALIKLSVDPPKTNDPKRSQSPTGDNSYAEAEVVPDK